MKKNVFRNILLSFGIIILVAVIGSVFVGIGMDWFMSLERPSQWIPNFIIPIVWSIIYIISAVIIYLILDSGNGMSKVLTALFILNGIFNILWCLLFFTLHLTFIGLIAIILNLILAIYLVLTLNKVNSKYFFALAIYPIWLSIATTLNLAIWILN